MIDESREVAANPGVDHRAIRQLEAPDVPRFQIAKFALEADLIRDLFAGVVDDPRVFRNDLRAVDTPPMDLGFPPFDHRI